MSLVLTGVCLSDRAPRQKPVAKGPEGLGLLGRSLAYVSTGCRVCGMEGYGGFGLQPVCGRV